MKVSLPRVHLTPLMTGLGGLHHLSLHYDLQGFWVALILLGCKSLNPAHLAHCYCPRQPILPRPGQGRN